MKRTIILTIVTLFLTIGTMASVPSEQSNGRAKSKIEKFLQKLPKAETEGINYTYISANMVKGLYSFIAGNNAPAADALTNVLKEIRYVKKFESVTYNGYRKLKDKIAPLLACDDEVMGLNLITVNREGKKATIIYSNKNNTLIINRTEGYNYVRGLSLVFIAGFSIENLNSLTEKGVNINF